MGDLAAQLAGATLKVITTIVNYFSFCLYLLDRLFDSLVSPISVIYLIL